MWFQDLLSECVDQPGKVSSAIEEDWIGPLIQAHSSSEECGLIREPRSRPQLSQLNVDNMAVDNDALTSLLQKFNCADLKPPSCFHMSGDVLPGGRRITKVVQSIQDFDG